MDTWSSTDTCCHCGAARFDPEIPARGVRLAIAPGDDRTVFEAIFDEETRGAIERAVQRIDPDADSREGFVAGCLAWLDEVAEPTTAEIALGLAPEVLGWRRSREAESAHSLRFIRIGLDRMVDAGRAEILSVPATARLVNAVLAEMAWSWHSGELQPSECRDAARGAIEALLGPG